jgi:hypothetical protein
MLTTIEELKAKRDLINSIDWSMTPEKAVDMYLEWGAGWTRGNEFARSGEEESIYFVIYDWEIPPQVTLLRRSSKDVDELAKIPVPKELVRESVEEAGYRPGVGVYALSRSLKEWLCEKLDGPPVE